MGAFGVLLGMVRLWLLKMPSRWKEHAELRVGACIRRRQWRGHREGKPFARADLRIWDGRANFGLRRPTQTKRSESSSSAAIPMM